MAIFGNNREQETGEDLSFLEAMAGDGLEALDKIKSSGPRFLSITADLSKPVKAGIAKLGEWYVSGGSDSLGKSIEVIPLGAKLVWVQTDKSGNFVRRGDVGGFEVKVSYNDKGYERMNDPVTGDNVNELILVALLIVGAEHLGPVLYECRIGSKKVCNDWVVLMRAQTLPSGKRAPPYAKKWRLDIEQFASKSKPGTMYYALGRVTPLGYVSDKQLFADCVMPAVDKQRQLMLTSADRLALEERDIDPGTQAVDRASLR